MTRLHVDLAGERCTLVPGRTLTMGRVGDLIIDDNPYLHRSFLTLSFSDGFWWLTNVGNRSTATVSGQQGLSRSTIGPGARIPLVFGRTDVTFSAGPYSYEINLEVESPVFDAPQAPEVMPSGDTTIGATSFTDSQLLAILAIAEPLLRRVGTGVWAVPTAVQSARRLGWTQTKFNRKLDNVCDKLDRAGVKGLKGTTGQQALSRRARLAEYAVNAQIVTARHLPALDEELAHNRNEIPR